MKKLDENYHDEGVGEDFRELYRRQESLREKVNEIVEWIFRHNNPPSWHHQELIAEIINQVADRFKLVEKKK